MVYLLPLISCTQWGNRPHCSVWRRSDSRSRNSCPARSPWRRTSSCSIKRKGASWMTEMLEKKGPSPPLLVQSTWRGNRGRSWRLLTRTRCDPVDGSYVGHCTGTACALGLLGPAVDAGGKVRPIMLLICNEDHITSKPRARNSQCDPSHTNVRVSRGGEVCPVGCRLARKKNKW